MSGPVDRSVWGFYGKAFLATVLWGCSFIAVRYALVSATPFGVVWMRNALAALMLFAILRVRGIPLLPERKDRGRVALLGIIFAIHLLIQTWALERTAAMRAGWIIAFIPAVVAIGAWLFQQQRLRLVGWAGILLASGGVFVVTATRPAQFAEAGMGDLLMFISTFTWAAYVLLSADPVRRNGGMRITASVLLVSVLPMLLIALQRGSWHSPPVIPSITALLYLGIGASGCALWLYADALAGLGPERSSAFQYIQPLVTMSAAALLLGEAATLEQFIGGPIVLAGVWMVQRGKRVKRLAL